MFAGHLALVAASLFLGSTLHLILVEQPARLALDDQALLKEWKPSDHRGFALLATIALIAAVLGLVAYFAVKDARWLLGAFIIMLTWPYTFFVMVPMNNRLAALVPGEESRQVIRALGWLEIGSCALGCITVAIFLWGLS
jgi:hypothetical protein